MTESVKVNDRTYKTARFENYREIVNSSYEKFPQRTAFQVKAPGGKYVYITYTQLWERYYKLCNTFLEMGLRGKRIAVIGKNSFEWSLSYLCAATVGCVVPLDKEIHTSDILSFVEAADCQAICYSDYFAKTLLGELPAHVRQLSFTDVYNASTPDDETFTEAVDSIEIPRDETQILIFTSGTTGKAKGVCLSQYNICSNIYSTVQVVKIHPTDVTLSILPLHHTYECTLNLLLLLSRGTKITYCGGLTKIQKNLEEYHPSILVVVPALLSVLDKRIRKAVAKSVPSRYSEYFETLPLADALQKLPFFMRAVVKNRVKATLGGKMRLFIVGAAELDTTLVRDFEALGIETLQGYGLTECAPLVAGNSDFNQNSESTGVVMPGNEMRLINMNDEGVGEIITRGDNVMLGYFNDPESTEKVLVDGWFHTGDLGYIDENGWLFIKGRIKNVIVTTNGKNIYPEELENRLMDHPEVKECIVIGVRDSDGKPEVKAKILPNEDVIAEELGHEPDREEREKYVRDAVDSVNDEMPSYKRIKIVQVLDKELEKTTTSKIMRYGSNIE